MTKRQSIADAVTAKSELGDALRMAMRGTAASVGALTVTMADGSWRGATINSMTSVSLSPPSILVSLDSSAQVHAAVLKRRRFAVNVFADNHAEMAAIFADPLRHGERFASGPWREQHGAPILGDAITSIVCTVAGTLPFGTHTIVVGLVEAIASGTGKAPLVYHDRHYGSWSGLAPG